MMKSDAEIEQERAALEPLIGPTRAGWYEEACKTLSPGTEKEPGDTDRVAATGEEMLWACRYREMAMEAARLQRFKNWVHDWLTSNGVPADPDPAKTTATGCRIGGRMEYLRAEVDRLKSLLDRDRTGLAAALNEIRRQIGTGPGHGLQPSPVGWGWIPAGEWGSYEEHEQSEADLRAEVGRCFEGIEGIAASALRESGRRADEAFRPGK